MSPEELLENLRQFTGTEGYTRYSPSLFPTLILTDGTLFLAENAGCYWLMDMVGSYLPEVKDGFAVVKHIGTPDSNGVFTITDDDPANTVYAQQLVEYSDFPLTEIKMYLSHDGEHWVLMLPSEY